VVLQLQSYFGLVIFLGHHRLQPVVLQLQSYFGLVISLGHHRLQPVVLQFLSYQCGGGAQQDKLLCLAVKVEEPPAEAGGV
jgi:hypothetical protein